MDDERIPEFGDTLAELVERLGDVPLWRIPLRPAPGRATEKHVLWMRRKPERWLCELAEGTLTLNPPGFAHSHVGTRIGAVVANYLEESDLGPGFAASVMYRLQPGVVRIPSFSFVSWERLPGRRIPDVEIADIPPDLVVEVPRPAHAPRELERKLTEYFSAGVRQVWRIWLQTRTADVCTSPTAKLVIPQRGILEGGYLLPGFTHKIADLFARLEK